MATALQTEEPYTDEERQRDIKQDSHLLACFIFFWVALFGLIGILFPNNSDLPPNQSSTPWFGILLEVIVVIIFYNQGAKAFGKPGIDKWPAPIRRIFQDPVWKTCIWAFFLIWFVISLLIAMSHPSPW